MFQSDIISVTGHRPNKLGGYNNFDKLVWFAECELKLIFPAGVITGMALGWDQAIAQAALNLNIPFLAAVPFQGQESIWPEQSKKFYRELLSKAASVEIISEGFYSSDKMQIRNKWMVDNSMKLLALWNGSSGGTANCVAYAKSKHKPIINCWDNWLAHSI